VGALTAGALGVHAIGHGLAYARGVSDKHAIKQVDRLLSNSKLSVWDLFPTWVPRALGERKEALVALDWTDFDADNQTTLSMHLVSKHGRATPLVWKTVLKSELKGNRAAIENEVIARFLETAPPDIKVTVLAERGFADVKLFEMLERWGADYVIRIRGNVVLARKSGEARRADEWVPKNGRSLILRDVSLTKTRAPVPAVVCVRAAKMKDSLCLATSRLLFIATLATALLTVLGAAGESLGMEKLLKANTSKKRSYSLLRQGAYVLQPHPTDEGRPAGTFNGSIRRIARRGARLSTVARSALMKTRGCLRGGVDRRPNIGGPVTKDEIPFFLVVAAMGRT